MKKRTLRKRMLAFFLTALMIFSLAGCTTKNQSDASAGMESLTKEDVISITTLSHPSWPYQEGWKVWEYIAEGTGATLDVRAVPATDVATKYPVMFAAPDLLTDIVVFDYKPGADVYASQGALISLDDMAEYMPNYTAFVESLSEEEYTNNIAARKASDGKIYYTPVMGREQSNNVRAWLYRKDVFEKHNLKVPETFDELYAVCKELKSIYPDSYPFAIRSGFTNLDVTGPSWKPYWETQIYYDFDNEEWCYGAREEIMRDVLVWYKKMVDEKLAPSDFMTINTSAWQELVTTDRAFIMPEYQTRIDFFNSIAQGNNEGFDLQAMVPPVADPETGVAMVNKNNLDPAGMVMCNTRDEKRIVNTAKYIDWFYTDEAVELVSWGKEGETFEVVDGKKKYITDENNTQVIALYGFGSNGSFMRMDPDAVTTSESADIAETRDMVLEHTAPYANPVLYLGLNEEEMNVQEEIGTGITTYVREMLTKFILGQEPISNFDGFVNTLNEMGVDELLAAYESAYNRIK